ncbi:MAG TPA: SurA N-terminal domain-containing protein, partial [Anaerolineaceae bacterium]|nr:SurA N-terminal domain-containing protein [Anaerolineaceae bacterium]
MKIALLLGFILLSGCARQTTLTQVHPATTQEPAVTVEPTVTPTSLPMALKVNGEGILLSEYESELSRLQAALTELGQEMTLEEQKERVLGNFTDELLLAQAAGKSGFTVTDEEVQARIDRLATDMGGAEKLAEWQSTNGYTDETFRVALKRAIAVAWQRDTIVNNVPETAEQIHARQLFFKNEANAIAALAQLKKGIDFSTLARQQDDVLGGDLGWFPRGVLTQAEVEEVVFTMQPGETSEIIASNLGYH